jgi:hypothetical protein
VVTNTYILVRSYLFLPRHNQMARTKQTARQNTGGKAPRKQLPREPEQKSIDVTDEKYEDLIRKLRTIINDAPPFRQVPFRALFQYRQSYAQINIPFCVRYDYLSCIEGTPEAYQLTRLVEYLLTLNIPRMQHDELKEARNGLYSEVTACRALLCDLFEYIRGEIERISTEE